MNFSECVKQRKETTKVSNIEEKCAAHIFGAATFSVVHVCSMSNVYDVYV